MNPSPNQMKPSKISGCSMHKRDASADPLQDQTQLEDGGNDPATDVPIVRDADNLHRALPVQDVENVLRHRVQTELLWIERLGGPSSTKQIRRDDPISKWLQECDLSAPVARSRREAVEEQQNWLLWPRWGEVVAVGVATTDYRLLVQLLVHLCERKTRSIGSEEACERDRCYGLGSCRFRGAAVPGVSRLESRHSSLLSQSICSKAVQF